MWLSSLRRPRDIYIPVPLLPIALSAKTMGDEAPLSSSLVLPFSFEGALALEGIICPVILDEETS